jgi:hypothetical protein
MVRPLLLDALPTFQPELDVLLAEWPASDPPGVCLELAEFGLYLATLFQRANIDDLTAGLRVVERMLIEGDAKVRDAASTCALEAFESHAVARGLDLKQVRDVLPPASRAFIEDSSGRPDSRGS